MSQDRLNRIDTRLDELESTQRVHAASLTELATAHDALRRYDIVLERSGADIFLRQEYQDDVRDFLKVVSEGLADATKRLQSAEMRMTRIHRHMDILEARVDVLEERSDAVMARLDRMDRWSNRVYRWTLDHGVRLDQLEQRLGEIDSRVEQLDLRMERLDKTLQTVTRNRTH
jgi:prefoldin subunit 5